MHGAYQNYMEKVAADFDKLAMARAEHILYLAQQELEKRAGVADVAKGLWGATRGLGGNIKELGRYAKLRHAGRKAVKSGKMTKEQLKANLAKATARAKKKGRKTLEGLAIPTAGALAAYGGYKAVT